MDSNIPNDNLDYCKSLAKEIEQFLMYAPGNDKWQHELSKCYSRMGVIHFSKGHVKEGSNNLLTGINILEQLVKHQPENTGWQFELARTYEMLGDFLHSNNDSAYAEIIYSVVVAIRKKIQGEGHPEYISSLITLAGLNVSLRKTQVAEDLLRQQLAVFEKMVVKEAPGYIFCVEKLADLYANRGNNTDSQLLYLDVLSAKRKLFGEKHPEYEATLIKLNNSYKKTGTLNSLYGDMKKAMQGNQKDKTEIKGIPALNKIDDMLLEAEGFNYPARNTVSEDVNFAISFPDIMVAAESYILDVWLFMEAQRNLLLRRIKEESSENTAIKSAGPVIIERGTVITARLIIQDLLTEPAETTLTWTGNLNNSSFIVRVPENGKEGSKIGQVYFYINGLEVSRLHFKVQVASKQKEDLKLTNSFASGLKYKTAFASYASDDRNDVLARVQGLEKAGIDVFLDVRNLRSGERYEEKLLEKIRVVDIFYLFWSSAAKKSEWVRKEWEYALNKRGIDFINPIPLEPPDVVPPPPELGQALHFGDWTLAYRRSKPINPQ